MPNTAYSLGSAPILGGCSEQGQLVLFPAEGGHEGYLCPSRHGRDRGRDWSHHRIDPLLSRKGCSPVDEVFRFDESMRCREIEIGTNIQRRRRSIVRTHLFLSFRAILGPSLHPSPRISASSIRFPQPRTSVFFLYCDDIHRM